MKIKDIASFYRSLKEDDVQKVLTLLFAFRSFKDVDLQVYACGESLEVNQKYKRNCDLNLQLLGNPKPSGTHMFYEIREIFPKTADHVSLMQEFSSKSLEASTFSHHSHHHSDYDNDHHTWCREEMDLEYFSKPEKRGKIETKIQINFNYCDLNYHPASAGIEKGQADVKMDKVKEFQKHLDFAISELKTDFRVNPHIRNPTVFLEDDLTEPSDPLAQYYTLENLVGISRLMRLDLYPLIAFHEGGHFLHHRIGPEWVRKDPLHSEFIAYYSEFVYSPADIGENDARRSLSAILVPQYVTGIRLGDVHEAAYPLAQATSRLYREEKLGDLARAKGRPHFISMLSDLAREDLRV